MRPAEDSVSGQQNPYAVGQAVEAQQSAGLLRLAIAVTIGVFTGLLATGIGFAVSWIAVGIILRVAAPQVDFTNSFEAAIIAPSVIGVLFGITTGIRVGWKIHAMAARVQQVKQKRADLAASASRLTEELKNARARQANQDSHPN